MSASSSTSSTFLQADATVTESDLDAICAAIIADATRRKTLADADAAAD